MPVEPALTTADAARTALAGLSDGPRAELTARYLRAVPGGYGEGDRFRGVAVPQIRAVVARTALDDDELERLVAGPWHEERMAALLIAVGRVKRLNRLLDRAQARPGSGTQTPPTVRDALAGREELGRRYLGWAARGAQAPRRRPTPGGLVHHSDHGSQYLSIAYTGRLVDEGIEASAGAVGSSYDNAAAEALGKSYKRELVWRDGPWKDRDDLETATAQWVNWYNRTRPHRANPDDLSPAAAEHRYHRNHTTTAAAPATA